MDDLCSEAPPGGRMKPMGQKPWRFPSKTDCPPPDTCLRNWREGKMGNDENKTADRRQGKRKIAAVLAESQTTKGITDGLC